MKSEHFLEAQKIWKRLSNGESESQLKEEIDVYRKLLNFFMTGDYYYYIFNVGEGIFDFVSSDITRVLGYEVKEIDPPFFIDKIHPEDQPWFLNFEHKVMQFFTKLSLEQIPNYKVRYDYRVRKKNGEYIRILQQVVTIQYDQDNPVIRTFCVHTDISYLKSEGTPTLSFIGMNGERSYINVETEKKYSKLSAGLTQREHEILRCIAEGKSSLEIGEQLFISKKTVDTHRKSILRKTGCVNTAELTSTAVKKGWI